MSIRFAWLAAVALATTFVSFSQSTATVVVPIFPLQFTAQLQLTAHLIEPENEYPPRVRTMSIYYDYLNKKARADIDEGYEAAKIYIRHYDDDKEFMVRLPPINACKRSFLGETMPFPEIPDATSYMGEADVGGVRCKYFLHEEMDTRVHMYFEAASGAPVRLIQEAIDSGVSTPLLTYDFSAVVLGPPPVGTFGLPFSSEAACERHVAGFPYLHIFHHFVRF